MNSRSYTVLGWIVWQVAQRVAKRKLTQNRTKLGAAGIVAAVVIAGALAARSDSVGEKIG